jgi:hypothetical protein
LQAGRNIRGLTEGQLFLTGPASHGSHHDEPGMDAHAYTHAPPLLLREACIELSHGLQHP